MTLSPKILEFPLLKSVIIIEDQKLLSELLTGLLHDELWLKVIAECQDGLSGLETTLEKCPDMVILDLMLPKMDGTTVLRQIKQKLPETKVLTISANFTPNLVKVLAENGASGFLSKSESVAKLREAVSQVMAGGVYYCPETSKLLRDSLVQSSDSGKKPTLSKRETDVLQLVGEGYSSKEIADFLGISVRTIEAHRSNIMRKLNLRSATDMVRAAIKLNLVSP